MTSTTDPATRAASKPPATRRTRRTFGRVRRLPSGRWQARFSDPSGRLRTAPTTFATRTAADEWLSTQRADLLRGVWLDPGSGEVTVAEFMRTWIAQRTDLSPHTRWTYETTINRWIDRALWLPAPNGGRALSVNIGARALNAVTVAAVREWYAAAHATQVREKVERSARGELNRNARASTKPIRAWALANGFTVSHTGRLSPAVIDAWRQAGSPLAGPIALGDLDLSGKPAAVVVQAYRSLRASMNAAVDDGLIPANPCRLKGAGIHNAAPRNIATPDEVRALATAMPDHLALAVEVAAWSALRAGELFALARRHVDLTAGTVAVERALSDVPGQPLRFGPPKTASSLRTVSLPPSLIERLSEHLDAHTPDDPDALVFANIDGSPVRQVQRTAMFDRARRAIARPDLRWHDLRHTGATLAARTGASVRELQHRLGHSTYAAAMRYQHASADRDRELADRLDTYAAVPEAAVVLHIAR